MTLDHLLKPQEVPFDHVFLDRVGVEGDVLGRGGVHHFDDPVVFENDFVDLVVGRFLKVLYFQFTFGCHIFLPFGLFPAAWDCSQASPLCESRSAYAGGPIRCGK
jgi:hypothetical protein